MKETRAPVAIDLFSGAGGLSEGLESSGIRVAVATDLHPQPALTYAFNHPNTDVLFGDIAKLPMDLLAESVRRRTGRNSVDLIVGGPPCQGFSTAGKKTATDPRNSLFHQFIRAIRKFKPRMFLLENVPGFKKMYNGQAFALASQHFRRLGYSLTDTILHASQYGVPQRRQRFVMVGWLPGAASPFAWPAPTHGDFSNAELSLFPMELLPFVTVEEALEDLAFLEPGWESHRHQVPPLSTYQSARRNGCKLIFNHLATRHRARAIRMFSHIREGETISSVPTHIRNAKRTMARLHRHSISNAVVALPDDLIHYRHNRIPTVREMARLQTFDDDYVFFGKRTSGFMERRIDVPQYTQVGNAVPPLLGRALGISLLASLGGIVKDLRDLRQRRDPHRWVQGSSGFAGYTLDAKAQGKIAIMDIRGRQCSLPVSTDDPPVEVLDPLFEWKVHAVHPKRGQWAPGVTSQSFPACAMRSRQD